MQKFKSISYTFLLQDPSLMSDQRGMKSSIYQKFRNGSKFNWIDMTLLVFSFLGVFDDIRQQVVEKANGDAEDWIYNPEFLYSSVVLPAFSIGRVLAKKTPIFPGLTDAEVNTLKMTAITAEDKKKRELAQKKARKTYLWPNMLGLLLAVSMAEDILEVLANLSPAWIDEIQLYKVIPADYLKGDHYFFGPITRLATANYVISASKRSGMTFKLGGRQRTLSAVLKMLPLAYLGVSLDKAAKLTEDEHEFCRSSFTLKQMYPQSYWNYYTKRGTPLLNKRDLGMWLQNSDALYPSNHWEAITTSDIIVRNCGYDMLKVAFLKLSAAHNSNLFMYVDFDGQLQHIMDIVTKAEKAQEEEDHRNQSISPSASADNSVNSEQANQAAGYPPGFGSYVDPGESDDDDDDDDGKPSAAGKSKNLTQAAKPLPQSFTPPSGSVPLAASASGSVPLAASATAAASAPSASPQGEFKSSDFVEKPSEE